MCTWYDGHRWGEWHCAICPPAEILKILWWDKKDKKCYKKDKKDKKFDKKDTKIDKKGHKLLDKKEKMITGHGLPFEALTTVQV